MKTVARIVLAAFAASVLYAATAIASMSAHAADATDAPVKSDYQARLEFVGDQLVAQQERESALLAGCNTIATSLLGAITSCGTDSLCKVMLAQEVGKLKCAGGGGAAAASAPAMIAPPEPPAPPVPWWEKLFGFLGRAAEKTLDQVPALAQLKLGMVQSDNATRLGMRQSDNALAATQSTNNAFAALGNNIQGTAAAGFRSNVRLAADAFRAITSLPPTTQINAGNGSPVTLGNGNLVIGGQDNRNASPGPCNAQSGNTTTTTGGGTSNATSPCTSN